MKYDSHVAHNPAEEESAVCRFVPVVWMWEEAAPNLTPAHQAAAWTQSQTPVFVLYLFIYGNNTVCG